MTEKVIDVIKKLFALAGNNPNQEEANAAMAKAQAMLAKHGLSEEEIKIQEETDTADEEHLDFFGKGKLDSYIKILSSKIAEHFKCMVYINHFGYHKSRIVLVGMTSDLPIVRETIHFAHSVFNSQYKKYHQEQIRFSGDYQIQKSNGNHYKYTRRLRTDFFRGFIAGMEKTFTDNEKTYALIVKTPFAVVEKMKSLHLRKGSGSPLRGSGNDDAWARGFKEGQAIGSRQKRLAY